MKVLILDVDKCTGCRSCAVACSTWHTGEVNLNNSCVRIIPFEDEMFYLPCVCQQCEIAYCELSCPVAALTRNSETGAIEVDKDRCVGCKMCLLACPLGANSFVDKKAHKCNLCEGEPKCVASCEYGALRYGEVEEIGDSKRLLAGDTIRGIVTNTSITKTIDVGTVGTKAQVMDALEAAQKKEKEAVKAAEEAAEAAQTARKTADELKKDPEAADQETVEKADKTAGEVEKQADILTRKAAKASAKAETAVKEAEDAGVLPEESEKE